MAYQWYKYYMSILGLIRIIHNFLFSPSVAVFRFSESLLRKYVLGQTERRPEVAEVTQAADPEDEVCARALPPRHQRPV